MRRIVLGMLGFVVVVAAFGCGTRTIADVAAVDDAAPLDGELDAAGGDAVVVDTAPAPITCGTASCDAATQECCLAIAGGGSMSCTAKGACSGGVTLACTRSADCASGEVCCFRATGGTSAGAKCQADCTGRGAIRLCTTDADCATGERCRSTPTGVGGCFP
ncbi:MAG: hypothetical protein HYV09_39100 [Deltaproteobacteria bacterium]|nr:hypothetical protein [Deltaproteobacteria bacterium]